MYPSLSYTRRSAKTQTMDRDSTLDVQSMSFRSRKGGVNRNKKDLRARCLNAVNFRNNAELKWVMETPYDIRDETMNDLLKGYSTNFAANRKMKFRSKKDPHQSIVILYILNIGQVSW
jgi:hypothetical protein